MIADYMSKLNTEGGGRKTDSSRSDVGLSADGLTVSSAVTKVRSGLDTIVTSDAGYAPGIRPLG